MAPARSLIIRATPAFRMKALSSATITAPRASRIDRGVTLMNERTFILLPYRRPCSSQLRSSSSVGGEKDPVEEDSARVERVALVSAPPDPSLLGESTDVDHVNVTPVGVVEEDGMEQEEMFVAADPCLGHGKAEWGGPRRGGRLEEPTRFGDWERKGRCTDF
uniref:Succinate dehydrogenase assembly factor 4, mitochondrial n=1 Tax=Trieres chinensis TaxID=1514140 RepID=A0A7S1ZJ87_TRICV|mmetsp:Transcript_27027/g.55342  ORF Transcript_27027/g.55342 Transcript_27027/m.55342 type:complete len:163 (+) Transcript_27027:93-581(+)